MNVNNKLDLSAALLEAGVKDSAFSVEGEKDLALCMEKVGGSWEVFYFERGGRSLLNTFSSEAGACEFMYDSLIGDSGSFV